ncbi:MAG: class I SAM-dependent methyltransferase [Verrucomicrobiota bacterium]
MSLKSLTPFNSVPRKSLEDLDMRLVEFYNHPPESYYLIADQAADQYTPAQQPFHCHLASQSFEGAKVLELGCGTAHLCPHVEARGGIYYGIDYSEELLEKNRRAFPKAVFWKMGFQPQETYDIVVSLYTIEHVTNPPGYLQQLWDYCRPGGMIGIICPDFVDGEGIPQSIYYGTSPGRIRSKIAQGRLCDALLHALEVKVLGSIWKSRARAMSPGAFWMNLDPSDLAGQEHSIDGDAVHFPRMVDIDDWFKQHGAEILATSRTLPNIPADILKHNCYVLAKKPA